MALRAERLDCPVSFDILQFYLNPLKNNRFGCLPAGKLALLWEREPLVLIIVYNIALLDAE